MCTDRRRLAAIAAAALLLVTACTRTPDHTRPTAPAASRTADSTAAAGPTTTSTAVMPEALQASFADLAATVPAAVGVAIIGVGTDTVATLGSLSTGVAWSTIKVPLAIAALRAGAPDFDALATRAITASDNAAAEQLWSELGSGSQAAQQVQAVLAEAGDSTTVVQPQRVRAGFTAFGQTYWPLGQQARFAAHLPCLADAGPVVELMRQLVAGQRWGLAADGAAAKGGWGPDESGNYLVRQFGVVSTGAGELGVALAAIPDDGTFSSGIGAIDQLAGWVSEHSAELPAGHCRPAS